MIPFHRSIPSFKRSPSSKNNHIDGDILNAVRNIGLDPSISPSLNSSSCSVPLSTSLSSPPSIRPHYPLSSTTSHSSLTAPPPLRRCLRSAPGSSTNLNFPPSPLATSPSSSSHSDITTRPSSRSPAPPPSHSSPLQPPRSHPPTPPNSSSPNPHPPTAPSSIEPTIDYSEVLEDIRNPPPIFSVPSHPPPPGHAPAAPPSDLSCGLLGRPHSPPPTYSHHLLLSSSDQSQESVADNGPRRQEPSRDNGQHRSSWDMNLSLAQRIAIWTANRNQAVEPLPSPTSRQDVCDDHLQTIWVPIRLVMDNELPRSVACTRVGSTDSYQEESPGQSTRMPQDPLQTDSDCFFESTASKNHSAAPGAIHGCRLSAAPEASVGGSGKGKQVDRSGGALLESSIVEPLTGGGPRPARRPPPPPPPTRRPPPPPPARRPPPPPLTRSRRPPPLPPKPCTSAHGAFAPPPTPTPLPASPAIVNEMLRRGSSLRRAPPVAPRRRPGTREEKRERDEEAMAFNRRSLPAVPEVAGDARAAEAAPPMVDDGRAADAPRPLATVAAREQARAADASQQPTDAYGPFTELDLLLLRVERAQDGTSYGDLQVLEELLGGPVRQPSPVDAHALNRVLRVDKVELVGRRVDRGGKVKQKLSVCEVRCNKCVVCLYQFKPGQSAAILPCSHVFHEECIKEWVYRQNKCPLCKSCVV